MDRGRRERDAPGFAGLGVWPHDDFHILIERRQHPYQALDRVAAKATTEQLREVRLAYADPLCRRGLR